MRALYALGHRRIGFVADHSSLWTARERHEGFAAATAELGCRTAGWVRRDVHTAEAARVAVTRDVRRPTAPTAVVTARTG